MNESCFFKNKEKVFEEKKAPHLFFFQEKSVVLVLEKIRKMMAA